MWGWGGSRGSCRGYGVRNMRRDIKSWRGWGSQERAGWGRRIFKDQRERGEKLGIVWLMGGGGVWTGNPIVWWFQSFPVCVPAVLPSFLLYPGSQCHIPALISSLCVSERSRDIVFLVIPACLSLPWSIFRGFKEHTLTDGKHCQSGHDLKRLLELWIQHWADKGVHKINLENLLRLVLL